MQTDTRFRANGIKRGRASHVESSLFKEEWAEGGGDKKLIANPLITSEKMARCEITRAYSQMLLPNTKYSISMRSHECERIAISLMHRPKCVL